MTTDALQKPSLRVSETLDLYQKSDELPGYPWEFGVTKAAEQTNGRLAMLGLASLAVAQVLKAGCPRIDGPAIAGKEPFCAAFSADGWNWLLKKSRPRDFGDEGKIALYGGGPPVTPIPGTNWGIRG